MYKQKLLGIFAFFALGCEINLLSMELDNEIISCDYLQGQAYYKSKKFELAKGCFKSAYQRGNIDAPVYLSVIYRLQKNFVRALHWRKVALEQIGNKAWYRMGRLFDQNNEIELAIKYYEIAASRGVIASDNWLGMIYHRRNELNRAIYHFRIAADNGSRLALFNIGVCYEDRNNLVMAKKYYKFAADQGCISAYSSLGMIYLDKNNLKKAKKFFQAAAKNGNLESLNHLGRVYQLQGRVEKAQCCYNKAVRKSRGDHFKII